MSRESKHRIPSSAADFRNYKKAFVWTVRQLWGCSSRLTLSLLGSSLINSFIPALSTLAIGLLIQSLSTDDVMSGALDFTLASPPGFWISVVILLFLLGTFLDELVQFFSSRLSDELAVHVQSKLYSHAADMELPFFEDASSLDKVFRFRASVNRGFLAPVMGAINFSSGMIQTVSLLGLMIWYAPVPALLLLVSAIPVAAVQIILTRQRFELEVQTTRRKRWVTYVSELITDPNTVPTIKIFGLATTLLRRFSRVQDEINVERSILHRRRVRWVMSATGVFFAAFLGVMLWMVHQMSVGALTGAALATFGLASFRARNAVWRVINSANMALDATLIINHILDFLETEPGISTTGTPGTQGTKGTIVLDSVTFRYPRQEIPVIKDLSLTIPKGQTVAVVGQNGAGKSTLMKLLCRLYDVETGSISLDGADIRTVPLETLYRRFSLVQQWPVQFEATVRENLAYGDWQKYGSSPNDLGNDLHAGYLPAFVSSLPNGLDTVVGRAFSDMTLSGGQWQQLAITRALLRRDAILILDEPTANLDALSEKTLFERICTQAKDQSIILVSHRFSTVRMVDRIIVLDDGAVVEDGSHEALMEKDGLYAHMYKVYHGD